jgi:pyruvate/2-oxoglutarate dehydrogenase complex dihydrolipoamide dehydrogenase (E3) component
MNIVVNPEAGVGKLENSIAVKVETAGMISQVIGTHVLVAIGRRPNTDDLGLEKAGTATDAHGYIKVDDQLRTTVPVVWAIGDLQWPWCVYAHIME